MARQSSSAKDKRSGTENGSERGRYTPDATRQAIIDSALKLFEQQGFHATSVQAVAADANVTKGAFYHHFESKEELVHTIHDEFVDYQLADIRRILEEVESPVDQVRELIRTSVLSVARFRSHVAVYFQERRYLGGERFQAVKTKRDEITRSSVSILKAGVDQGLFKKDIDVYVATFSIVGMSAWSYQWLRESGPLTPEKVADMMADMVLSGLEKE